MTSRNIPLAVPFFDEALRETYMHILGKVFESGWLTQGEFVSQFEQAIAATVRAKHCLAVSSCTTALHLGLQVLGLKAGDEVLMPSYSFVATANAALYCGLTPRFCDIDERTFNLDPADVERRITPQTKALLAVHQFGMPADIEALSKLAKRNNLILIEDAACSMGSTYDGKPTGSFGLLSCFSFHPRKVITSGEGGAVVTNDPRLAERVQLLRSHGMTGDDFVELGYNYRMTELQAALGLTQIQRMDEILGMRRSLALRYHEQLGSMDEVAVPIEPADCVSNYQSYAILLAPTLTGKRDQILKDLEAQGISARPGIRPIHTTTYFQKFLDRPLDLPATQRVSARTILLPLYAQMTEKDQDRVVNQLKRIVKA